MTHPTPNPVLLLDEPSASLDQKNRQVLFELIAEAKARGAAIVGIFHNVAQSERVATSYYNLQVLEAAR